MTEHERRRESDQLDGDSRPTVAIWKDAWLPPSETFIENQIRALSNWDAVRVGIRPIPGSSATPPDMVGWPARLPTRATQVLGLTTSIDRRYARFVRRTEAKLIHAHFLPCGVQALPIAKACGIPLLITAHGSDVTALPHKAGFYASWFRRHLPELIEHASAIVAVSNFIAAQLHALGVPGEKVVVRPTGIPVPPTPTTSAEERSGIIFVGRLIPQKGVDDLLNAVHALPPALKRTEIRIVGDGPCLVSLKRQADDLGIHARFLGSLPPAQVREQLARSSVFAGPSRSEGFGMVFLEAAANALPVVGYRQGGVPEAVADGVGGLLCSVGDTRELSANIARLLHDDGLRKQMGLAGRRFVEERFNIASCTQNLERLYGEVVRA